VTTTDPGAEDLSLRKISDGLSTPLSLAGHAKNADLMTDRTGSCRSAEAGKLILLDWKYRP